VEEEAPIHISEHFSISDIFSIYITLSFSPSVPKTFLSKMTKSGEGNLKEELIGHATLAVLAVIGLALYSTTYSLVYAGSSSTTPVVAVFEMWMVSIQLASPVLCGTLQALFGAEVKTPVYHVAVAQTAVFLGIACIVTIQGINCVQQTPAGETYFCGAYYGAAAVPRFAAAGSVAWVWVMYVSSLGCQSSTLRLSLGLTGKNSLTVASIVLLVPYCIASKLGSTCGGSKWTKPLCNNACGIAGPIMLICLTLLFSHGGGVFIALNQQTIGIIVSIIGPLIMIIGTFSLWVEQTSSGNARHIITSLVFSTISLISSIYSASKLRQRNSNSALGKNQRKKFSHVSLSKPSSIISLFSDPTSSSKQHKGSSKPASTNATTGTTRSMFPSSSTVYQRLAA